MGLAQQVAQLFLGQVAGTGCVVTKYPVDAAGVALTASGKTTGVYKFAAAGANVKQIVAKATIASNSGTWRLVGFALDTFSATGIFVIRLGRGAAAGAAMAQVLYEAVVNEISAAGVMSQVNIPPGNVAVVAIDGANDGLMGDAASSNAGADDTVVVSTSVATNLAT